MAAMKIAILYISLSMGTIFSSAFAPSVKNVHPKSQLFAKFRDDSECTILERAAKSALTLSLSLTIMLGASTAAFADTTASAVQNYDGFADYAKENQMEKSDVGCFINKCGDETKGLFSNPRGIKGVSCLGRCKGEQACATRYV